MAAENKSVASFVNLCRLLMEELGMPEMVLNEFVRRVCGTNEVESFRSVRYWKSVTADFYVLEEKIAMGPFKSDKNQGIIMKPQIPDLNQSAPEAESEVPWELDAKPSVIIQDHAKVVEVEAEATTTTSQRKILQSQQKREITQANHGVAKRFKFTEESAGPSDNVSGKGIFKMEGRYA